jgi:hypothetical protein
VPLKNDYILEEYSKEISKELEMPQGNYFFFYDKRRINRVSHDYFKSPNPIQVLDPNELISSTVSFKIVTKTRISFYNYSTKDPMEKTLKDALCFVLKDNNIQNDFFSDFEFTLIDFMKNIDRPISYFHEKTPTISINFIKKTKKISLIFNGISKIFHAGIKTTFGELTVKAQILFELCHKQINLISEMSQVIIGLDLKICNLDSNDDRFQIQINHDYNIEPPFRGLIIECKCMENKCSNYQNIQLIYKGLGIFDMKLLDFEYSCEKCLKFLKISDFGFIFTKNKYLARYDSNEINQETLYLTKDYKKGNYFPIANYTYLTIICI